MMVLTDFSVLESAVFTASRCISISVVDVKSCYFNRREVLATSTSPCCLTLTSRFPGTTGCCSRGQALRLGRSNYTATILNRTVCRFFFSPRFKHFFPGTYFLFPQLKFLPFFIKCLSFINASSNGCRQCREFMHFHCNYKPLLRSRLPIPAPEEFLFNVGQNSTS